MSRNRTKCLRKDETGTSSLTDFPRLNEQTGTFKITSSEKSMPKWCEQCTCSPNMMPDVNGENVHRKDDVSAKGGETKLKVLSSISREARMVMTGKWPKKVGEMVPER